MPEWIRPGGHPPVVNEDERECRQNPKKARHAWRPPGAVALRSSAQTNAVTCGGLPGGASASGGLDLGRIRLSPGVHFRYAQEPARARTIWRLVARYRADRLHAVRRRR